jgi:hypothetical protein|tara:strand:+ start:566 stop:1213 length:648 start_codon:yes stop_codon:yes gene_type:complete
MEQHANVRNTTLEPSPWWLKGAAIAIALFSLPLIVNIIFSMSTPFLLDFIPSSKEICGEDPQTTGEEQEAWQSCMDEMDVMIDYFNEIETSGVMNVTGIYCAILLLISIPTIVLLWTGDRELGIKLAWAYIAINFLGGMYTNWLYLNIGMMPLGPEEGMPFALSESIIAASSYAQIGTCNLILAGLLVMVSQKSKSQTNLVIPSAFHQQNEPGQH